MKGKKLAAVLALLMAFLLSVTAVSAEGSVSYEWSDTAGAWVFMQDGQILTNQWVTYEGEQCYAGEDGSRYEDGVFQIGDAWYVFDGSGVLQKDGLYIRYNYEAGENEYYYAQADGKLLANAWGEHEGEKYYFGENHKAFIDGVYEIDGDWYAFDSNAVMHHGDIYYDYDYETEESVYYYAQEDGKLVLNNWQTVYEQWYYFGEDGRAYVDGVFQIGDVWYGFNTEGWMYDNQTFSFGYYDEEREEWVTTGSYRAKEGGALYVNEWYRYDHGYGYVEAYYYGEGGKAPNGFATVQGKQYYFGEDGYMFTEGTHRLGEEDAPLFVVVHTDGTAKQAFNNQWTSLGGYWYYVQDGDFCYHGIYTIGGKQYGFDENYRMYYDALIEIYDSSIERNIYYYAQGGAADGALAKEKWIATDNGWYYFGEDGKAYTEGVYEIGGKLYGFAYEGIMYDDTSFSSEYWDEELWQWVVTGHYRAKAGGALYVNEWYRYDDGYGYVEKYYYGADGKEYTYGLHTIDGVRYVFDHDHRLVEYEGRYEWEDLCFFVDENGVAKVVGENQWAIWQGYWYYVQNGMFCWNDVYEIGGKLYGFDWDGRMYYDTDFSIYNDGQGDWDYYYAQGGAADGALARNQWIKLYDDGAWYYFGNDGLRYESGIYQIGSRKYAFSHNGELRSDEIVEDYATGKYYYATHMDKNGNGGSIATYTKVWKAIDGSWVYFTADSSLHVGWLENHKYYMQPEMTYGTYFLGDDGYVYVAAANGATTKLTSTGFIELSGHTIYLENGKPATEKWIQSGGKWYYFDEGSAMVTDGAYYVKDVPYFFDVNGVMASNRWALDRNGYWYFARPSGVLMTDCWGGGGNRWYYFLDNGRMVADGMCFVKGVPYFFDADGIMADKGWVTDSRGNKYWAASSGALFTGVDSAGYVFDEHGVLVVDDVCNVNGTWYVTNAAGKKVGSFSTVGWHQVGSYWYYVEEYDYGQELVRWDLYDDRGRFFTFDNKGRMLANQFYERYYLGSNGNALTGWFKVGGVWYYGNPEDYGYLYNNGIWEINGKEYFFGGDGKLLVNTTAYDYYSEQIVTTNYDGAVVKKTAPHGWSYRQTEGGYGYAYYHVNGKPYTGWVGNYYIEDGMMAINRFVEGKDGKQYYLDKKGLKVKGGWYQVYENDWIYANADGSLVCDNWLQQGKTWYYFSDCWMVYDGTFTINGEQHSFDQNGVWLGKNRLGTTDGWKAFNGEWYYIMAEQPVRGEERLINGAWYAFDYEGKMVADSFYSTYGACFYYTASGVRANYVGWKVIDGKWVHFDRTHKVSSWVVENGKRYYIENEYVAYDGDVEYQPYMVTGYHVINERMYYFDNNGVLIRAVRQQGWLKVGVDWYYIDEDGWVVSGVTEYKIGNVCYAFDYAGKMIAKDIAYSWYGDGYSYYDAGGKLVTKQGWYTTAEGKWIYVLANGKVAANGVYKIGGKEYYFSDGLWVE